MTQPDPRRRSPTAGSSQPQQPGDVDGRFALPPPLNPNALSAPAPPGFPESDDTPPPGYSVDLAPDMPPSYRPARVTQPATPSPLNPPSAPGTRAVPTSPAATPPARLPANPSSPAPTAVANVLGEQLDLAADSQPFDVTRVATEFAPPWLVSMLVHVVLIMVMAMIQFSETVNPILLIEASTTDAMGEQPLDDSILTTPLEALDTEMAFSKDVNPSDNPLAAMPKLEIALDAPGGVVNLAAPSIGMALTGREKGAKEALLAAYGGSAATEGSVGMALEWLRKQQQRDGTWSLTGPFGGGVTIDNKLAATAMALLAFQGNGETHLKGPHRDVVSKGLKALLKMQDPDGNFVHEGVIGHRLYAQAMASIVVCELYGMTKDPEVKVAAERALAYAAKIQADDGQGGGGWRYHPGQDVDTSVTGWFVMAYQSGRMAGLDSHSPTLQRVSAYLDHVEKLEMDSNSIKDISYFYRIGEDPKISMTAEALLCRQYLGWDRNEPRLVAGVQKLLLPENRIKWDEPNFYYWYYATQVMHHMGGNAWHEWNQVMREVLPKKQDKSGPERGSWGTAGDQYGYQGGRLYSTCFCVFMLESYYRHLPIYQQGK